MSQVTMPVTQPMADLYRTFHHQLELRVEAMSDAQLEGARVAFGRYRSDNCEWTHYHVRDIALRLILSEERRRRRIGIYADIKAHEDAIAALRARLA